MEHDGQRQAPDDGGQQSANARNETIGRAESAAVFGREVPSTDVLWDVVVIGGGAGGLTAAEYLARFKRRVLVIDADNSRLSYIPLSHNFPSRPEGVTGSELLLSLRQQAAMYCARLVTGTALRISKLPDLARDGRHTFEITVSQQAKLDSSLEARRMAKKSPHDDETTTGGGDDAKEKTQIDASPQGRLGPNDHDQQPSGQFPSSPDPSSLPELKEKDLLCYRAKYIVLATGVEDHEPPVSNLKNAVKRGLVRHCPVCDAYEVAGQDIGVIGYGQGGLQEAAFMRRYSDKVTLLTLGRPIAAHGHDKDMCLRELGRLGVHAECTPVTRVTFCDRDTGKALTVGDEPSNDEDCQMLHDGGGAAAEHKERPNEGSASPGAGQPAQQSQHQPQKPGPQQQDEALSVPPNVLPHDQQPPALRDAIAKADRKAETVMAQVKRDQAEGSQNGQDGQGGQHNSSSGKDRAPNRSEHPAHVAYGSAAPIALVHLQDGRTLRFDTLYSALGGSARTCLALQLGVDCKGNDPSGRLRVSDMDKQATSIQGVYAVGDLVFSLNQIAVAMGSAAIAATAVNKELMDEEGSH